MLIETPALLNYLLHANRQGADLHNKSKSVDFIRLGLLCLPNIFCLHQEPVHKLILVRAVLLTEKLECFMTCCLTCVDV